MCPGPAGLGSEQDPLEAACQQHLIFLLRKGATTHTSEHMTTLASRRLKR